MLVEKLWFTLIIFTIVSFFIDFIVECMILNKPPNLVTLTIMTLFGIEVMAAALWVIWS